MSIASRRIAASPKRLRMLAMEERWEASGHTDLEALRHALISCGSREPLPPWAVEGLLKLASFKPEPMQPPYHEARWMLVRIARAQGLSLDEAYDKAAEWSSQWTPKPCKRDQIMKSYQRIERKRKASQPEA
jgi:hypothetical protein